MKSNKLKKWLAAPYAVWAAGFIIIPLILILYYAFTGEEGGFTLSNFAYVATKENIKALGLALWLSLLSTALCLLLAYPLAMILSSKNVNQSSFIVLIFILPPSWDELRSRLENRGEDAPEVIELRMKNASTEMAQVKEFDFVIINELFESALFDLKTIIHAHRLKYTSQRRLRSDVFTSLHLPV